MTRLAEFGIFQGGNVTKSVSESQIHISSYLLTLSNGTVTGSGENSEGIAKRIQISFVDNPTASNTVYSRSATQVPTYYLNINRTGAGTCWIYYDEGIMDVALSLSGSRPSANVIVFAKLSWSVPSDINDVVISTGFTGASPERNESYQATTINPDSSSPLYYDGQRWTAGGRNIPLANFSIFNNVIQAESKFSLGSEYFVTLAKEGNITVSGTEISVAPFKSYARNNGDTFKVFDTKANPELSDPSKALIVDYSPKSDYYGQMFYLEINKSTGEPQLTTARNSGTHHLIAQGYIPDSGSDYTDVDWEIVNNLGGQLLLIENQAQAIKSQYSSGFMREPRFEETGNDNTLTLKGNIINIDGYIIEINDKIIDLGAAPVTGSRRDFVYLEITKSTVPWTRLNYDVKVVNGVDFSNYYDPFLEPAAQGSGAQFLIRNDDENNYVYQENGYYSADDSNNEVDGKSYALPIAVVHRWNQQTYTLSEPNGGAARTDGRSHNRITLTEVEKRIPFVERKNDAFILTQGINKLLKGELNNRIMPAIVSSDVMSRKPLQVDRIGGSNSITGTSFIGKTDGQRYTWDNNEERDVYMYALLKEDLDSGSLPEYTFVSVVYNEVTRALILQVPPGTEGELVRNDFGHLKDLKIVWVSTGEEVAFSSNWATGQPRVSSNVIDPLDGNYIAGGEFAVMFKVRYLDSNRVGLTKPPKEILSAAVNNDTGTLSNTLAVAIDTDYKPRKVKNMSRSTTVDSTDFVDYISITRLGDTHKFFTYEYSYYMVGNGTAADYVISDNLSDGGTWQFNGIKEIRHGLTGELIPIDYIKWTYGGSSEFQIRLGEIVPVDEPVRIVFGVGGSFSASSGDVTRQIDINAGSLSIDSLSETEIFDVTGDSSKTDGIYRFSSGHLIFGVGASRFDPNKPATFMAMVGEDMVPVTVNGIGTNYIEVDFSQSDITGLTGANWAGAGPYYPDDTVSLRLPVLQSHVNGFSEIYIQYLYSSLPFIPYQPENGSRYFWDSLSENNLIYPNEKEFAQIKQRGWLLISNDGIGNERSSYASPFSERFPPVQGIDIVGVRAPKTPLGWQDVLIYQQLDQPLVAGTEIKCNEYSGLGLQVSIEPGSGVVAWCCLVKQLNMLRMFVYTVRDGQFILNDPSRAFICELDENYREPVR